VNGGLIHSFDWANFLGQIFHGWKTENFSVFSKGKAVKHGAIRGINPQWPVFLANEKACNLPLAMNTVFLGGEILHLDSQ